ncbi:MAG: hypothetical protein KJ698_13550, partial [Actinobacteria bacterium]|nr:hypothetical protein [Actinomycetota bacterium]MBU1494110.1 hypothetical protein [Actinomycetota bacterium]
MGSTDSEMAVALAVAAVSEWAIGRPLGMPCRHDDGSEPMMVDFLFKKTSPPVALEITAVVDTDFVET